MRALSTLLLTLALAACGRAPSGPRLTVAINAGVEGSALKTAAQEWGAAAGVAIQVVELPYASLFEKELLDLTSRTGAYDVIMMDDPWFPRLAEDGNLAPLEPLAGHAPPDPDFLASCLDACRYPYPGGPLYALPYVGNSQLFFYRKDLFDRHGLAAPQTWDDVLRAARLIGGAERMYGYVMRAAPGNAVVTDFMPLLWAFGADLLDAEGRPALESPEAAAALRFMLELGRYTPPGYAGFNADEVAAHLLQSTAVMSINWPSWIAAMDDPAKSRVAGKIEFTRLPAASRPGQASLGAWLLGIPAASRNHARAYEFITWATAAPQLRQAALRGNPPTRRSVFEDPDLLRRFRSFPAQLASLESARPRPRTPFWNEIENSFGVYLSQANSGSLAPEEALRRSARDIRRILERGQ